MKKTLIFCLIFSIIINLFAFVAPVYAVDSDADMRNYNDEASLFDILGIFDYVPYADAKDQLINRGEFAQIVAKMLDMSADESDVRYFIDVPNDHWAVREINFLASMGIISVPEDKKFNPGQKISEAEALKMLLSAAGYTEYADDNGGYPSGYYRVASLLRLTTNGAEQLTVAKAINLAYQVGFSRMLTETVVSTNLSLHGESKDTIMSLYHDCYLAYGVIMAVDGISLDKKAIADEGFVRIGDETYATSLNLMDMVGYKVRYVYRDYKIKGEIGEVLYVNDVNEKEITVTVNRDEFVSFDENSFVITYNIGDKKVEKDVAKNAVVVKNGEVAENTKKAFEFDRGEIKLIDTDRNGFFETIIIFSYENYVVSAINTYTGVVYDKVDRTKSICLDSEHTTKKVVITTPQGSRISFSDIAEGNVVSVCESSNYIRAYVSSNIVTGGIFSIDNSEDAPILEIGKNESDLSLYKLDKFYYEKVYKNKLNLAPDMYGDFYTDYIGNIAYIKLGESDEWLFAYLIKYGIAPTIDQNLQMKLFVQDGTVRVIDLAESVLIDGYKTKENDKILAKLTKSRYNKTLTEGEDSINGQLIMIKLNADGKIKAIDTEYSDPSKENTFNLKRTDAVKTHQYRYHARSFSGKLLIDGTTYNFGVPNHSELAKADDKDFYMLPVSYFHDVGDAGETYVVEGFHLDEKATYESATVVYGQSKASSDGCYLVKSVSDIINSDGMEVKKLVAWKNGIEYTMNTTIDFDLSQTINNETYYVSEGDIITINRDFEGNVNGVTIHYDYSRKDEEGYKITWGLSAGMQSSGNPYSDRGCMVYVYVKSIDDGVMRVMAAKPTADDYKNPRAATYSAPLGNGPIMIYDSQAPSKQSRIYIGTIADIIPAEYDLNKAMPYFLNVTAGVFQGGIIYR